MSHKLGTSKSEDWILYKLRKLRAETKPNPFEGDKCKKQDFKVFLTPRDEEEVKRQCRKDEQQKCSTLSRRPIN